MENKIVISAKDLSIGYPKTRGNKERNLYKNLSFDLFEGELVCLIGSNGAGKSTLLRTISKMQASLGGDVKILGKCLSEYRSKELSQLMGLVLTDKTTTGGFTVKELVELGRYPYTGFFGILDEEDKTIVHQALKDVGIEHKSDSYVADLSDGERQKAMIAKALSQECPIIILDEPTAFLDIESRIEIMNLLHNLAHKQKKTILLSTHDIDLALLLADKLWLLSKNSKLIRGVTEDIILSGEIDCFFSNKNIAFNKYSGSFYPIRSSETKVFVDAEDEYLFWTINLLLRLGLDYTMERETAVFTIKVESQNSIYIIENERNTAFRNFEQLAQYLKTAKHNLSTFASHIQTQEDEQKDCESPK